MTSRGILSREVFLCRNVIFTQWLWQDRWREKLLQEAREKQRPLSLETLMVAETFTLAYTE
jgi:hypothetical protein